MAFQEFMRFSGALQPDELALIRRVFDRTVEEPWVSRAPETREALGRYIFKMYDHGLCVEERLFDLCLAAARHKFSDQSLSADASRKASGR